MNEEEPQEMPEETQEKYRNFKAYCTRNEKYFFRANPQEIAR